jgi:L-threonylcarbamoyladenylate synthase
LQWHDEEELLRLLATRGLSPSVCHVLSHCHVPSGTGFRGVSVIPHDPDAYARALYAELHRCDAEGAEWIVVEALPAGPVWEGIADRLRRAAEVP